ncbi:MAG: hypothetical protein Q8R28_18375 [Dehalococcoidia bacterium]|nr:hypothetical protein [Dehalococcoidia bacterium]
MKIVITVMAEGRTLVGVQQEGTDPFIESLQTGNLGEVLAAVPAVVARAVEHFATEPKGKAYVAPTPLPRASAPAKPAAKAAPKQGSMTKMF